MEVHKGLKEEEGRVRGELGRLEKELKSLRVLSHEQKCQATAIYTNLSRITGQVRMRGYISWAQTVMIHTGRRPS